MVGGMKRALTVAAVGLVTYSLLAVGITRAAFWLVEEDD